MFQTWVDNIVAFQVFLAPIDIVADDQEDWLGVFKSKKFEHNICTIYIQNRSTKYAN